MDVYRFVLVGQWRSTYSILFQRVILHLLLEILNHVYIILLSSGISKEPNEVVKYKNFYEFKT